MARESPSLIADSRARYCWLSEYRRPKVVARSSTASRRASKSSVFARARVSSSSPWGVLSAPHLRDKYIGENWDVVTDVTEMRRRETRDQPAGERIRFNWRDKRMEFKTTLPVCRGCQLEQRCEGVWQAYLDIYGPDEFAAGPAVVEACLATG